MKSLTLRRARERSATDRATDRRERPRGAAPTEASPTDASRDADARDTARRPRERSNARAYFARPGARARGRGAGAMATARGDDDARAARRFDSIDDDDDGTRARTRDARDAAMREELAKRFPTCDWREARAMDDACVVLVRAAVAAERHGARALSCGARRVAGEDEDDASQRMARGGSNSSNASAGTSFSREAYELEQLTAAVRGADLKTPEETEYKLVFCGADVGGMLSRTMQVVDRIGLEVKDAQAHKSVDGMALNFFTVVGYEGEDERALEEAVEAALVNEESEEKKPPVPLIINAAPPKSGVKRRRDARARGGEAFSPSTSAEHHGKSQRAAASFGGRASSRRSHSRSGSELSMNDSFNNTASATDTPGSEEATEEPMSEDNSDGALSVGSDIDSKKLQIGRKIGEGTFGTLYHGIYPSRTREGRVVHIEVALKYVTLKRDDVKSARLDFFQEVKMLRTLKHANLVGYVGSVVEGSELCLVTEFMAKGPLLEYLRENGPMRKVEAIRVAVGITRGMTYLHEVGVIHRDLRAANVLLSGSFDAKISDFGLARRVPRNRSRMTAETGTYRWMAPEVITHGEYDVKADVFSFAITLWEIVTGGANPYGELNPLQAAVAVVQRGIRPPIPHKCDPLFAELMQNCWKTVPQSRPRFRDLQPLLEARDSPEEVIETLAKPPSKSFFSKFRFGRKQQ